MQDQGPISNFSFHPLSQITSLRPPAKMDSDEFIVDGQTVTFRRSRIVGFGSFGYVYHATRVNVEDDDVVQVPEILAVKWLNSSFWLPSTESDPELYFNKLVKEKLDKILKLKHHNVLRYFSAYLRLPRESTEFATAVIVMEYADGSLDELIKKSAVEIDKIRIYCRQLLTGLTYLHANNFIHTDLKPANILLFNKETNREVLKIGDLDDIISLGGSVTKSEDVQQHRGTGRYFSPEMASKFMYDWGHTHLQNKRVGRKTDIWSLGCILLDMVRGGNQKPAFKNPIDNQILLVDQGVSQREIISFIHNGGLPEKNFRVEGALIELIGECLQPKPTERPSAAKLLLSSFISPLPKVTMNRLSSSQLHMLQRKKLVTILHENGLVQIGDLISLHSASFYSEMETVFMDLFKMGLRIPLKVILGSGHIEKLQSLLGPMAEQVVVLHIADSHGWNSDVLQNVSFQNLVELSFSCSDNIVLRSGDFERCRNLRVLSFNNSSIEELHENIFEELPSLLHFGVFDRYLTGSFSETEIDNMQKYITEEKNEWLRKHLEANRWLTATKEEGDVWRFGPSKSQYLMSGLDSVLNKLRETSISEHSSSEEDSTLNEHEIVSIANTGDVRNITRAAWGARPAKKVLDRLVQPVPNVVFIHTDTYSSDRLEENINLVRRFQNFHMDTRGWDDVGYNFLIGAEGSIFEGRGWYSRGAFNLEYNASSIGVAFIGNFAITNQKTPTTAALVSAQYLVNLGVTLGHLTPSPKLISSLMNDFVLPLIEEYVWQ